MDVKLILIFLDFPRIFGCFHWIVLDHLVNFYLECAVLHIFVTVDSSLIEVIINAIKRPEGDRSFNLQSFWPATNQFYPVQLGSSVLLKRLSLEIIFISFIPVTQFAQHIIVKLNQFILKIIEFSQPVYWIFRFDPMSHYSAMILKSSLLSPFSL